MRKVKAEAWAKCKKYVVQYDCPFCNSAHTMFVDDINKDVEVWCGVCEKGLVITK